MQKKKKSLKKKKKSEIDDGRRVRQLFDVSLAFFKKNLLPLFLMQNLPSLSKICSYLCISFFLYFIINSWASKEIRKRKLIFGKGKYLQGNDKKVNLI